METSSCPPLQFVLKTSARCNLNCSYCYVFNKGDNSWRHRPRVMSDEVFDSAIRRIYRHCKASGQQAVRITFHGGEPMLAGLETLERWLGRIETELAGDLRVIPTIQTNGTLIDDAWAVLFAAHDVEIGVSLDGPPELNDRHRV